MAAVTVRIMRGEKEVAEEIISGSAIAAQAKGGLQDINPASVGKMTEPNSRTALVGQFQPANGGTYHLQLQEQAGKYCMQDSTCPCSCEHESTTALFATGCQSNKKEQYAYFAGSRTNRKEAARSMLACSGRKVPLAPLACKTPCSTLCCCYLASSFLSCHLLTWVVLRMCSGVKGGAGHAMHFPC